MRQLITKTEKMHQIWITIIFTCINFKSVNTLIPFNHRSTLPIIRLSLHSFANWWWYVFMYIMMMHSPAIENKSVNYQRNRRKHANRYMHTQTHLFIYDWFWQYRQFSNEIMSMANDSSIDHSRSLSMVIAKPLENMHRKIIEKKRTSSFLSLFMNFNIYLC